MMHVPTLPTPPRHDPPAETGGRLVSTTGRALPLLGSELRADAAGGLARVTLEQRFHNPYAEPLAVTYSLPLPADGAVSGFAFRIGDRRVVGEIDRRASARERFERALLEGRSAALLEQDRSSLFTQEIGNIPPGEEVIVEVSVDQRLRWLDEGAWEWRFPTVVEPRYLGAPGRVPDADRIAQDVADGPVGTRFTIACAIRDALAEGRRPESPSHALASELVGGAHRISLRDPLGAKLDRDVVVRWMVAKPQVGLSLDTGRAPAARAPSRYVHGLLTIVPPSIDARRGAVPRDLIVLLDTSGSMQGPPLEQAVRVTTALIETLRDRDRLELIEFSSAPRRWKPSPVAATASTRREAIAWLRSFSASGATEMRTGVLEALARLRDDAQRQVVLVTDGAIGFESQVIAAVCDRLPVSSRLHTVGVGSAVNRSLTGPAARAGRGVEVVVGLGEDAERAASRLVARTNEPLLVDLTLTGSALVEHAPARLPDLFASAPALVSVALRPEGGDLLVRGRTLEGTWEQRLRVTSIEEGFGNQAAVALFGREAVEDLELRLAAGGDVREIDAAIERIGIDFQIATRLTSWVVVSHEATVDPEGALRRERMPHELAFGVSAEGLGLRAPVMASPTRRSPARRVTIDPRGPSKTGIEVWGGRPGIPMGGFGGGGGGDVAGRGVPRRMTVEPPRVERGKSKKKPERTRDAEPPEAPRRELVERRDEPPKEKKKPVEKPKKPAPPPAPKPVIPAPVSDGVRRLRGRVAQHRGREVVIEAFAGNAALAWASYATLTVVLADGRSIEVTVDPARTTRAGTLAAGQVVRVALAFPEAVAAGTIRRIVLEKGSLEITLGAA
jgi:Ca-activated chloride channel family protein